MGRGHGYGYEHMILIDVDKYFYDELHYVDEHGNEHSKPGTYEWRDDLWDMFLADSSRAFNAERMLRPQHLGRDIHCFADNDKLMLCIDHGGGMPCLFIKPKLWHDRWGNERAEYIIDKDANRGFNKLITEYPGLFQHATSAWTSQLATKY